jgi:hypothetical protein
VQSCVYLFGREKIEDGVESILLGSDDSSDDSDNETLQEVTTAVPAAAAVAATVQAQKPPPPVPAPAAQAATGATLSQSELSSRLKDLYSPATKHSSSRSSRLLHRAASRPVQQTQATQPQQAHVMNARVQQPSQAQPQRRNAIVQPPQANPQQQQQRQNSQSSASDFRPLMPNARGAAPSQPSQQPSQPVPKHPSASAPADPFEPTPLKTMIQRQQQKAAAQAAAAASKQATLRSPGGALSASTTHRTGTSASSTASQASTASTVVASNTDRARQERDQQQREAKHRKERFLMFTRVLIKYLEQKDPSMHLKAKAVIRECAEKNKNKEPGYESVTNSMQKRLRAMVGDNYWARAEAYLDHFLKQKQKIDQKKKDASSSSSSSRPSSSSQQPTTSQPKTEDQIAKDRLAAQKLEEIQREKEKVKQRAEMQRRMDEEERRMAELKKEQLKKEALARAAARNAAEQQAQAAAAAAQAKKKKDHRRKGSGSTASGLAAAAAARASSSMPPESRVEKQPTREYSDLMQTVDHAVDYDWTSAALLLGKEARTDVSLSSEQKRLLYGNSMAPPRQGVEAAQSASPTSGIPTYMQDWGKRNVLSSRGAWARVRLREQRNQLARGAKQPPIVGGLSLPSAPQETQDTSVVTPEAQWFNEERAEQDKTLALMSEATQMYLKSILEKSLVAARQRENLDGIRLWHLQHGPSKPPMSLRLGCDVNRQVAQAEGNAAKTVQRMEEALERQTRVPAKARALDNDETLYNASSMADLALRPKLANAAEEADTNAKRSFEVFGGKEVTEAPPFGRVPKRPKITAQDCSLARELADYSHQHKGIATPQML